VSDLRLEGVSFEYPDGTPALDGIDLDLPAGTSLALVGPNGSGKSTLARHLDGLLRPTRGRLLVDGADAASRTVAQLARVVGLSFQRPDRQIFGRTVREEVEFGPRRLGRTEAEAEARVREAVAVVGLGEDLGLHPDDLGETRRRLLAIASVLAMDTSVVVLDEPTAGLDAGSRERYLALVDAERQRGAAVVTATHDIGEAMRCQHAVLLAQRVVASGPPAEVLTPDNLLETFGVALQAVQHLGHTDVLAPEAAHAHHPHGLPGHPHGLPGHPPPAAGGHEH
jgi:energy-coupling factor transporter ATP-binding protein EcfA2